MADRSTVETLAQALAQLETIEVPARNLAIRTRREYSQNVRDLLSNSQVRARHLFFV